MRAVFLLVVAGLAAAAAPSSALPIATDAFLVRLAPARVPAPAPASAPGLDARDAVWAALAIGCEDEDITLADGREPRLLYVLDLARVRMPCGDAAGCERLALAEVASGL